MVVVADIFTWLDVLLHNFRTKRARDLRLVSNERYFFVDYIFYCIFYLLVENHSKIGSVFIDAESNGKRSPEVFSSYNF